MQKRIRVLIADDHLMVRKGLRLMLEEDDESIELVGDAADGASALTLIEQLQPDVVLMDVRMPGMDGITALQHIRSSWSQIAVIILTTYDEDDLLVRALQAGACGYLLKDTPLEKLLRAIHTAARGEMLLQPDVMARVLAHTHQEVRTPPLLPGRGGLTRREQDVLSGIARGERSKEVAARLGITE
ncbi:MAG: response regulator transcription factor, partial [Ktedonobacteraceae bacterium]|nr:response regulator transcription factor [Ktedonobacteraceae bacterium]